MMPIRMIHVPVEQPRMKMMEMVQKMWEDLVKDPEVKSQTIFAIFRVRGATWTLWLPRRIVEQGDAEGAKVVMEMESVEELEDPSC